MKTIHELLENLQYDVLTGSVEKEVTKVIYDSRKIEEGCLFICIKGANFNGHDFVKDVVEKGAAALVVSEEVELPEGADVTVIRVEDTRYAMAFISAAYFEHPADKLKIIGITLTLMVRYTEMISILSVVKSTTLVTGERCVLVRFLSVNGMKKRKIGFIQPIMQKKMV